MQKHTYIAILGIIILVMFSPLGLPSVVKQIISLLAALGIVLLALFAYREHKTLLVRLGKEQKSTFPPFVDNQGQN